MAFLAGLSASAAEYGSLTITAEAVMAGNPLHGYTEYAVSVTNHSHERSHEVTLRMPRRGLGLGGNSLREISRQVEVRPGASVRVSLFQPPLAIMGDGIEVVIDGRTQEQGLPFNRMPGTRSSRTRYHYGSGSPAPFPYVLISRNVSNDFKDQAEKALAPTNFPMVPAAPGARIVSPSTGSAAEPDFEIIRGEPIASWSTNWLAYTSFDGIVLTEGELRRIPAAVQTALFQYLEAGGSILVLGTFKPPEFWEARKKVEDGYTHYYIGYGHCLVSEETNTADWSTARWSLLREAWRQSAAPFQRAFDVSDANSSFPVIDDLAIPVTELTMVMAIFAFIIGPINFYVLGKMKRQIWILWTIPVISLLTCITVFGYATFAEGWRGHLRTETLTILDENTHRATTIGWTGFYAPLTPGDGLRFSPETELLPQLADASAEFGLRSYRRGGVQGTPRTLEWHQDQHLATGWISARVPSHFKVRKSEIRRERISVVQAAGGQVHIVNGLGSDVRELWLADKEGRIHHAADVPAGNKIALQPVAEDKETANDPKEMRQAFSNEWTISVVWTGDETMLSRNPAKYLLPNTYIATMDDSPFLEDGLSRTQTRRCRAIVYGILREAEEEP